MFSKRTFGMFGAGLVAVLVATTFSFSQSYTKDQDLNTWVRNAEPGMLHNLLNNISPAGTLPGTVIASPSKQSPNYFFHWIRDAALVMDVVVDRYAQAGQGKEKNFYADLLKDFIALTRRHQQTPTPSNGPGEPKFNVDGTPYTGDWGRPQNDGPALRAIALINLAKTLLQENREDRVRETLYDDTFNSPIKLDLEFVSHHWRETCFDLWEETRGHHFYTQLVQRRALVEGAKLAQRLNDHQAANWYAQQAREIEHELMRYWDGNRRILMATIDRDGGADYKYSNLDSAVILGLLHGSLDDGFLPFSDEKVLGTLRALEKTFQEIYPVNNKGHRGITIGRYPEDRYDGVSLAFGFMNAGLHARADAGNPWFLTTMGFAEFYYRLAHELKKYGPKLIHAGNAWFFNDFGGTQDFNALIDALRGRGDDFMAAAQFHMSPDGHISEQINRYTGFMQGAQDLTWSYASFLTATRWR